ncbi:MAG: NAD(P)H-dependent oxidoreductase subunit E [Candidatus Methylacidiphilales bacterium]|nr:NAD(P)H-dependent oxidoreductase subunit E [Candidatus Methylacidiphilales bacterium]
MNSVTAPNETKYATAEDVVHDPHMHDEVPVTLTPEFLAHADVIVSRYPVSKRSAVMPLLYHWQDAFGYCSQQGITWIAQRLEIQPINVLEVVTFYPMFRQHPVGKLQIKVCRTLSCALAGSYETCEFFRGKCGITEIDEHGLGVSADGKFSVEFVECLASCGSGPVVMVNDDLYEKVSETKAAEILTKIS